MLSEALDRVGALLPASWSIASEHGSAKDGGCDEIVTLARNGEAELQFVTEIKRSGAAPSGLIVQSLRERARTSGLPVLFVSDYIGPTLRDALSAESISFADGTGWVGVYSDDPLILMTGRGAPKSTRTGADSTVRRLNGASANRTIRTLTSTNPPFGVRDLAQRAEVSPSSVSKLLPTLEAEGIIDRDERGRVVGVRRRAAIRRWVQDYSFAGTNDSVGYYIAPRGLERTVARLEEQDRPIALTGSAAARRYLPDGMVPVVPLRLLALYTTAPKALAASLGLVDSDPGTANVVIARPQDTTVLDSARAGALLAPIPLVVADLLTLPNRSDAEADQLLDALARTDSAWIDAR